MSETRAQREDRMARDDGDPEATVFLHATSDLGSVRKYHTGDCYRGPPPNGDETRAWSRRKAQRQGHPPCRRCVLGVGESSENGTAKRDCPLCGEPQIRVPQHIRSGECDHVDHD